MQVAIFSTIIAWLTHFIAAQRPSILKHINSSYSRRTEDVAKLECIIHHFDRRGLKTAQYSQPFFVRVLNISLLATVDIMLSSLFCFAILVLTDNPQRPPPATPGPATDVPNSSEQKSLPVVAGTDQILTMLLPSARCRSTWTQI